MTKEQIKTIKAALSTRRLAKYGHQLPDRETWLAQMDTVSAETGLPNVYRLSGDGGDG